MSSLLLVSSAREAFPRDQLPLGAPDCEVIFEPCHVAWQTAIAALPGRTPKGTQRGRQGWAGSQRLGPLSEIGGSDDVSGEMWRGHNPEHTPILAPEGPGFPSQPRVCVCVRVYLCVCWVGGWGEC